MATSKRKQARSPHYNNLHELFILKLRSLYDIEQELTKAIPKMAKHASDPALQQAFQKHLAETENQVKRLEIILGSMGEKVQKESVSGVRGIVKDAEWVIKEVKDEKARDAALIGAAQYVELYESAGYGTAREWARLMNHKDAEELLTQSLHEEEAANMTLTKLAEGGINAEANSMEEEETHTGSEKEAYSQV